jgi:hypothetical protein
MRYAVLMVSALYVGMAWAEELPEDTNEIKTLTVEQAQELLQHEGELDLGGLTTLSDEAAKALSQHKGELNLSGLTTLSDEAAGGAVGQ